MKDIPLVLNEVPKKAASSGSAQPAVDAGSLPFLPKTDPLLDIPAEAAAPWFSSPLFSAPSEPADESARQTEVNYSCAAPAWQSGSNGVPLLGGLLYITDENDGITTYRYVVTDAGKAKALAKRCILLRANTDLNEFIPYFGMVKQGEDNILSFSAATADRLVSLRKLVKNRETSLDVKAIRDNLLLLLDKLYAILPNGLGVLGLDTVFLDRKGRLRILPVGIEKPAEYPVDSGSSADMYAVIMLTEELIQHQDRLDKLTAPDDEETRRCLLPVGMRPQLTELLEQLGLDGEAEMPTPVWQAAPAHKTAPAAKQSSWLGRFLNWLLSRPLLFFQDEKADALQEGTPTHREGL